MGPYRPTFEDHSFSQWSRVDRKAESIETPESARRKNQGGYIFPLAVTQIGRYSQAMNYENCHCHHHHRHREGRC